MELFVTEIIVRVFRGAYNRDVGTINTPKSLGHSEFGFKVWNFLISWFVLGRCKYLGPTYNTITLQTLFITADAVFVAIPKLLAVMFNVPQLLRKYNVTATLSAQSALLLGELGFGDM